MTNPNLTIRPLEIGDFPAFVEIQREALVQAPEVFGSDHHWFESLSLLSKGQRFERYINFPYQYLLAAVDEQGRIAGMMGYSGNHGQVKLRHRSRIWGLFVLEEFRGAGVATDLVTTIIQTARDLLSVEQIHLTVSTANTASYGLYLRLGFSVYGTESRAIKVESGYVDEYLMVKFLV